MEFWRIYRLIYAKRWLIAAMTLIAAAVILLGTTLASRTRQFQAEARMQPQELNLTAVVDSAAGNGNGGNSGANPRADTMANISDLIMMLRSSNDLYLKTAELLQASEDVRAVQVQRILERNGYFAAYDDEIESMARQLEDKKELPSSQAAAWIKERKEDGRRRIVGQLAKGRDDSGPFAAAGVKLSDAQIMERIRKHMAFDTVAGPLSTDATPQIVNQIQVTAKFDREAEANLYANLICVAFMDFYTNQKSSVNNARIALLRDQLAQAERRLARARQAEVAFRKQSGVSLTTAVGQGTTLETRKNDAEAEYSAAAATAAALEGALKNAKAQRTEVLPTEENPAVRAARERLAAAESTYQSVTSGNLGPQSDPVLAAKAALESARRELNAARSRPYTMTMVSQSPDEIQSKLNAARANRDAAANRLNVLTRQLAEQRKTLANLPAAQARLADLTREITISESNVRDLETTLAREERNHIQEGRAGTVNIVSRANAVPLATGIAAQRGKLLAYGVVLALLFGVALVVGMDALDNSVRTPEDVEKLTGLPVAGIIPAHLPDPIRAPRTALLEPLSPAAEAYRLLRTDLLFTAEEKPFKSLMMATGKPGQGATTTICNLAIVLAQTGRSVILVDADLRSPKLHRIFGTQNATGLSTVLANRCSLDDALTPTGIDNLMLLPSGYIPMNPSELLSSVRMRTLHEQLKERADFVLFDSPSAIAFSDGPVLASIMDATLMVVRSSNVPRGSEDQVRSLLDKARANIIGVVLNGVPAEDVDSVHYHYHYYPVLAPPPSGPGAANGTNGSVAYSNGNGASANGQGALPIALPGIHEGDAPGVIDEGTDGGRANAASGAAATLELATLPLTAPGAPEAEPFTDAYAAAPAAAAWGAGAAPPVREKNVPWKTMLLVLIAGAVLGGLVLLLGSGTTVR
jgi:capsular exopolysaccharide synthesis family protein